MAVKKGNENYCSRAITSKELDELLKKYNIGKKPLAKLLGWGETTVLLYSKSSDIPDNEYTRKLYSLYYHPGEYYELLTSGEDKLTKVAYIKSLQAVNEALSGSRLLAAVQYIVNLAEGNITKQRVEAVLLISQIVSLVLENAPIFDEDYHAGRGNIPYRGAAEFLDKSGFFCRSVPEGVLSTEAEQIMDSVYESLEWYGTKAIQTMLAAERFRMCGKPEERKRRSVSKEMMKKCYKEVFSQARIHKLKDIDGYIQKRMSALRKTL